MVTGHESFPVRFQFPHRSPLRFYQSFFPLFLDIPSFDLSDCLQYADGVGCGELHVVIIRFHQKPVGRGGIDQLFVIRRSSIDCLGKRQENVDMMFLLNGQDEKFEVE